MYSQYEAVLSSRPHQVMVVWRGGDPLDSPAVARALQQALVGHDVASAHGAVRCAGHQHVR